MDFAIALIGLAVGFLVGLTGVGGAALLTPILLIIGINPAIAVGTDLFYNSITKLFGTVQHLRQKTVNMQLVKYFAYGSIPGAIAAVGMLSAFKTFFGNQDALLKHALGFILIIVALTTIYRQFANKDAKWTAWQMKSLESKRWITIVIGFVLGFMVGLTSIGSGSLFALALMLMFRMKASEIVGTDIAHAFLLVSVAGLLHAGLGHIDYMLAVNLLIGSVPGVIAGSGLSAKVPAKPLRMVVAMLILISGIKLI